VGKRKRACGRPLPSSPLYAFPNVSELATGKFEPVTSPFTRVVPLPDLSYVSNSLTTVFFSLPAPTLSPRVGSVLSPFARLLPVTEQPAVPELQTLHHSLSISLIASP